MASANSGEPPPGRSALKFTIKIPPVRMEAQETATPGGGLNEEGPPPATHAASDEESDSSVYKDVRELGSDEATEPEVLAPVKIKRPVGQPCKEPNTLLSAKVDRTAGKTRVGDMLEPSVAKNRRFIIDDSNDEKKKQVPASTSFDVFVETLVPAGVGRGRPRNAAKTFTGPCMGPFLVDDTMKFGTFISEVAKTVGCHPDAVVLSTLSWKFFTPASSVPCSVKDEAGYDSMICSNMGKKGDKRVVISLTRAEHAPVDAIMARISTDASTGEATPTLVQQGSTSFDKTHDRAVKAKINALNTKYPIGKCEVHPNLQCLYHAPTGLHWELTLDRITSWANHLVCNGSSDLSTLPSSNLFHPRFSLPKKKLPLFQNLDPSPESPAATIGSTSAAPPGGLDPATAALLQALTMQQTMMASMFMQRTPLSGLPAVQLPAAQLPDGQDQVQSSPPPEYEGELEEWGKEYHLSRKVIDHLEEWGFSPGLTSLKKFKAKHPDLVKAANFKPMEWDLAEDASDRYRVKAKKEAKRTMSLNEGDEE